MFTSEVVDVKVTHAQRSLGMPARGGGPSRPIGN